MASRALAIACRASAASRWGAAGAAKFGAGGRGAGWGGQNGPIWPLPSAGKWVTLRGRVADRGLATGGGVACQALRSSETAARAELVAGPPGRRLALVVTRVQGGPGSLAKSTQGGAGWARRREFVTSSRSGQSIRISNPRRLAFLRASGGGGWGGGGGSWWDPQRVLLALLGANAAGWAAWGADPEFMQRHAVVSAESVSSGRVWTLVTSAFSHRDGGHLLVNSVTLYFFGRHVGRALGGRRLAGLYLAGGVAGSAAHALWTARNGARAGSPWQRRAERLRGGLGASAAINAVVATSLCLAPWATVYLYGIVPVPAALLGAGYLLWDLRGAYAGSTGGIGHVAHLAGTAVGALAYLRLRRGSRGGRGGAIRGYR